MLISKWEIQPWSILEIDDVIFLSITYPAIYSISCQHKLNVIIQISGKKRSAGLKS